MARGYSERSLAGVYRKGKSEPAALGDSGLAGFAFLFASVVKLIMPAVQLMLTPVAAAGIVVIMVGAVTVTLQAGISPR